MRKGRRVERPPTRNRFEEDKKEEMIERKKRKARKDGGERGRYGGG